MPYMVVYLLLAILSILALLKIATAPIRPLGKLALNTALGFLLLVLLNLMSVWTGLQLGINWLTALLVGTLGLPGVGLLLAAHWLLL